MRKLTKMEMVTLGALDDMDKVVRESRTKDARRSYAKLSYGLGWLFSKLSLVESELKAAKADLRPLKKEHKPRRYKTLKAMSTAILGKEAAERLHAPIEKAKRKQLKGKR
jgi:hypothetical protein